MDRNAAGRRAAGGVVVGVGWVLVADQRRAGRGGDPRAVGNPHLDGGHAGGLARRARRLRRVWGALRLGYFVVRLLHVVLFALATGNMPETHQAILRLADRKSV